MAALDTRETQIFEVVAEKAAASFQSYAVARLRMASGGGFDIGGYKKLSAVEFGNMGGRIEKLSRGVIAGRILALQNREDVADGGGVEAVRTEKLIEQWKVESGTPRGN